MDADVMEKSSDILLNNQNAVHGDINSIEDDEMCFQDQDTSFVESHTQEESVELEEENFAIEETNQDQVDPLIDKEEEIVSNGYSLIPPDQNDIRKTSEIKSMVNNLSDAQSFAFENQDLLNSSEILMPSASGHSDLSDIVSTDPNHEVIAISDDEDGDSPFVQSSLSNIFSQPGPPSLGPSSSFSSMNSMNFTPMPSSLSMPPPPPLRPMFPPRSFGGPSDVITLSDDDDEEVPSGFASAAKRKKSSRRRSTMFNPIICPYCYKPKRETVCMSKHMISRHWMRVRSQNMGTSKSTDYANIKDDREIPVEKYKEDRYHHSNYPPPPPAGRPSTSRAHHLVEQPLRPSFPAGGPPPQLRGVYSRPVPGPSSWSPSTIVTGPPHTRPTADKEAKSLGQEVAEELGHPSNRKLVQSQLSLLMHANKCDSRGTLRKQNSFFEAEKTCTLPQCSQTKELLRHLPSCQAETDCPVPKCFMSKQIVKWALSPDSPEMMRSELNKQAHNRLPQSLVDWANKNKFEKGQWKNWREKSETHSRDGNDLVQQNATKTIPRVPDDIPEIGTNDRLGDNKGSSDWKMKYQQAKERMKTNQKSQKIKNGQQGPESSIEDKIVPSGPASVDILSSLLSAQTQSADLRRGRKRESVEEKEVDKGKKVPKLIPAPESVSSNGDEAALYNSMLSL